MLNHLCPALLCTFKKCFPPSTRSFCCLSMAMGVLLISGALSLSASEAPFDAKQIKRVVVLYSGPPEFPATEQTERGIREVFLANPTFHIQLFSGK